MRHKAIAVVHELVAFVHVATVDETPFYMEFPTLHDNKFAQDDRKPEQMFSDIVNEWVQSNKRFLAFDWGVSWHNWADANDRQNSGHSMAVVVDRNRHLINFFDSNGTPITSPLIKCLPNTLHTLEQVLANNGFNATLQQWFGTRQGTNCCPSFSRERTDLFTQNEEFVMHTRWRLLMPWWIKVCLGNKQHRAWLFLAKRLGIGKASRSQVMHVQWRT